MPPSSPAANDRAPVRAPRRGSGGVTLADVARLAGVSAITVSRALNTPALVSPETRERVRRAVGMTGYVPNLLAGGLASNRSRLVAALVPTIAGPVFLETVQALTAALADEGYQLMLGQSGYDRAREDALVEAIVGRRPDGILLTGILHSSQARRRLLAAGIPVVETWDLTPTPIDMLVGFSHAAVGQAVARFLHARGYRRPLLIGGDDHRAAQRADAFCDTLAALGVAVARTPPVPAPTTLGHGRAALAAALAAGARPDCVFCSSDALAHGVITEAQARGIAVPDTLAVMGFGDLAFARDTWPAIATVRIDGTGIGQQAARFLVQRARGQAVAEPVVDVGFAIVERESVGRGAAG